METNKACHLPGRAASSEIAGSSLCTKERRRALSSDSSEGSSTCELTAIGGESRPPTSRQVSSATYRSDATSDKLEVDSTSVQVAPSARSSLTHLTALSGGSSIAQFLSRPRHDRRTFERAQEAAAHLYLARPLATGEGSSSAASEPVIVEIVTPSPDHDAQSPYVQFVLEAMRRESSTYSCNSKVQDDFHTPKRPILSSDYGQQPCVQDRPEGPSMDAEQSSTRFVRRPRCKSMVDGSGPKTHPWTPLIRCKYSKTVAADIDKATQDDGSSMASSTPSVIEDTQRWRRDSDGTVGKRRWVFGSLWTRKTPLRSDSQSEQA